MPIGYGYTKKAKVELVLRRSPIALSLDEIHSLLPDISVSTIRSSMQDWIAMGWVAKDKYRKYEWVHNNQGN